jgi:putative hemolysin
VVALSTLHCVNLLFPDAAGWIRTGVTFVVAMVLIGIFGVVLPLATSSHAAEAVIGRFVRLLRLKRLAMLPFLHLSRPLDGLVRRAVGRQPDSAQHVEQEIEQEILDIVNEGRDEGVIGEGERVMIERTLRFHDVTAGQAMTPRGEVIALPASADADEVLRVIEDSGHSRIPVYEETLDRVIGVLYARDLFRYVGKRLNGHDSDDGQTRAFTLAEIVRKPLVVPETKKLSDLLREIQLQKIHIAIVLDEYGGTSGLVTIEDVLEELVGEIADEHEDDEAPLFDRIDDRHAEADARIEVEEINRLMGLGLPEEDGFETLGGYVTTTLGRIPSPGTTFEHRHNGSRVLFTVLDAEPHRVNRLSVELAAAEESPGDPEASGDSKQG